MNQLLEQGMLIYSMFIDCYGRGTDQTSVPLLLSLPS